MKEIKQRDYSKYTETLEQVILNVGQNIDVSAVLKKRTVVWARRMAEGYSNLEVEKKPSILGSFLKDGLGNTHATLKYRDIGPMMARFLWECILLHLQTNNPDDKTLLKEVADTIRGFKKKEDLKVLLVSCKTVGELREHITSFASSYLYPDYYEYCFEVAKTQEDLFFIVRNAYRFPVWPKAVKALAKLKGLKPFHFDYLA
jgi:hypothetical protein